MDDLNKNKKNGEPPLGEPRKLQKYEETKRLIGVKKNTFSY